MYINMIAAAGIMLVKCLAWLAQTRHIAPFNHCYCWDARSEANDSGMRFQEPPPPPAPRHLSIPGNAHGLIHTCLEPGGVNICCHDRCMLLSCGDVDDVDPRYYRSSVLDTWIACTSARISRATLRIASELSNGIMLGGYIGTPAASPAWL